MRIAVAHKLELQEQELSLPIGSADAVMGESVSSFLERAGWQFDLPTICIINGEAYSRAEWDGRCLGLNDNIEFITRPLGGGSSSGNAGAGKQLGAIIGLLALSVLAPYAMGAIGLTGVAASVGASVLIAGGSLLLSHLLQPKTTGKSSKSEEIYSFSFQANTARPLQAIPVQYGRILSTPDLASPSYSEFSGDSMVEYGLYALTCGAIYIEEIRIDDTTVWTVGGGADPAFPGLTFEQVQPGGQVTLFPANVVTASEVSGVELTTTATPGYTVNAAGTLADTILIDLVWPSGAFTQYKDRTMTAATGIFVEARLIDAAGAPLGGFFPLLSKTYSFAKQSQVRITERVPVGPGRYEIRAQRTNPSITGQTLFDGKVSGTDTVQWTALRAHIQGPQSFPGVTTLAVRAEANASLNGVTNGKLRVIGTRILPVWNGSAFVDQPTRSIAWAALDAWRNADYSAGMSVDNVDFQSFLTYDGVWAGRGDSFDHVFTTPDSLDAILETILKAGRSMPSFIGDRLTIVREEPRGIPRMMFNDNNIIADSLEIDYIMSDPTFADGVSGQYVDETTWRTADITSAPNGALLNKPAQIEVVGVVKRRQAAELVRFHAAEHLKRRITVTWQTGSEGKLLKKGDLVTVTSEQPETWGQSGEVIAYTQATRTLQISPAPAWDATAPNHYVQVQQRDGRAWGPVRVNKGATDDLAILIQTDLDAETTRQGGVTIWDALLRDSLMEPPPVDFSPGQPRAFPVIITEGTPDQDGEHITLKGVQDDPTVYDIDGVTGVPVLPTIPDIRTAGIPTITALGIQIFQRAVALILSVGWQPAQGALTYEADVSYDGVTWVPAHRGESTTFEATVSGAPLIYVRVRGRTADGTPGGYAVSSAAPPDLVAAQEYVTFKLTKDDFEQKLSRVFDSLDLLQASADLATESRVIAHDANELGKANVEQISAARVDLDRAYAIFGTTVTASYDSSGATLSDMLEGLVTGDEATAIATSVTAASVGPLTTTVTQQATAFTNLSGQMVGSYIVKVAAGNYWGGLQIVTGTAAAGAIISEFRISTDMLLVGPPGGGASQSVFTIATVGGVAKVAVRGDLYADGTIGAGAIQTSSLSALSANLGTVTAGTLTFPNGAGLIQFYDAT